MTTLRDKSVLILGLGETGLSLARYLHAQGARLRVADSRAEPPGVATLRNEMPQAELHCGAFNEGLLQGIDSIAISPGVPVAESLVQMAMARGIRIDGDIELLAQQIAVAQPKPKVIAITGANGKTTTTSMVGAMCVAAGLDAQVAGNISPAVLDALRERGGHQPQAWVLELSSFQLETTHTLDADAAVVLNVSEDHLDRYEHDMELYAAAKMRVFNGHGVQVLNRDDARSAAMALVGRRQVTFGLTPPSSEQDWGISKEGAITWLMQGAQKVMRADELQVAGLHNVANALAALALCRALDLPLAPLVSALRAFKGLPHRVEEVAQVNGVTYYDDSKGTNVGATEAALNGLGKQAVVILGGDGKGQDFSPLKLAVEKYARAVVLIGRDAPLIASAIAGCDKPVLNASDMDEAVRIATANAQRGDAVLMSPACASFDMYRNYLHRAEAFVAAVRKLQAEATC
ncbi:MAG: UDP-N-acetylmuramoyl-L-alanine--D-glutamate ligase [Sideroxydans sp.]|nr:UDP-N-acetylmuramoyl-L-alanine--D-glutamate ligase [Sideroxydans sp.]